jgi:putative FmdB family regulatory protein
MPLYEYACGECGVFDALRPLSRFQEAADCPHCGEKAGRVIATAPALSALSHAMRTAHNVNERSANVPKRSGGAHGLSCACCTGSTKSGKNRVSTDGGKSFAGARPWMISH